MSDRNSDCFIEFMLALQARIGPGTGVGGMVVGNTSTQTLMTSGMCLPHENVVCSACRDNASSNQRNSQRDRLQESGGDSEELSSAKPWGCARNIPLLSILTLNQSSIQGFVADKIMYAVPRHGQQQCNARLSQRSHCGCV